MDLALRLEGCLQSQTLTEVEHALQEELGVRAASKQIPWASPLTVPHPPYRVSPWRASTWLKGNRAPPHVDVCPVKPKAALRLSQCSHCATAGPASIGGSVAAATTTRLSC